MRTGTALLNQTHQSLFAKAGVFVRNSSFPPPIPPPPSPTHLALAISAPHAPTSPHPLTMNAMCYQLSGVAAVSARVWQQGRKRACGLVQRRAPVVEGAAPPLLAAGWLGAKWQRAPPVQCSQCRRAAPRSSRALRLRWWVTVIAVIILASGSGLALCDWSLHPLQRESSQHTQQPAAACSYARTTGTAGRGPLAAAGWPGAAGA